MIFGFSPVDNLKFTNKQPKAAAYKMTKPTECSEDLAKNIHENYITLH
jgi:hypothetical protein